MKGPRHRVTISYSFAVGVYEVTRVSFHNSYRRRDILRVIRALRMKVVSGMTVVVGHGVHQDSVSRIGSR